MKRRRLLIGLGGLAGAGTAFGSGAFSSISANRDVTVNVADDNQALLKLDASTSANGQAFAEDPQNNNGLLALDFSRTSAGGQGVGTDSVYDFDDVFTVTNQGTQPVYVWANFAFGGTPYDADMVWLYPDSDSGTRLNDGDNSVVELPVGKSVSMGVHVETEGVSLGEETLTATINANATKPSSSTVVHSNNTTTAYVTTGSTQASNRFATLDEAVDSNNGPWETIRVEEGTFVESSPSVVQIETSGLTIEGIGGTSGGSCPTIVFESDSHPDYLDKFSDSGGIEVEASDVTIEGICIEMKNTSDQDQWESSFETGVYVDESGFEMRDVDIKTRGYAVATSSAVSDPHFSDIDIVDVPNSDQPGSPGPAFHLDSTWSSVNGTSVSDSEELVEELYDVGVRPLDRGIFDVGSGTDNHYPD